MRDPATYGSAIYPIRDPAEYPQNIIGGDLDFSYEHFSCYGQVVYNVWNLVDAYGSDLKAMGYSFEGAYTVAPRFSIAARAGGLVFNSITATVVQGTYTGKWDNDVFRLEGGLGYRVSREVMFKIVYQWNTTMGAAPDPPDNVFGLQAVASF
jgi:hypothetical protein